MYSTTSTTLSTRTNSTTSSSSRKDKQELLKQKVPFTTKAAPLHLYILQLHILYIDNYACVVAIMIAYHASRR